MVPCRSAFLYCSVPDGYSVRVDGRSEVSFGILLPERASLTATVAYRAGNRRKSWSEEPTACVSTLLETLMRLVPRAQVWVREYVVQGVGRSVAGDFRTRS